MEAASPIQTVLTSARHICIASYIPMPAVTDPPGELMKSLISCQKGIGGSGTGKSGFLI